MTKRAISRGSWLALGGLGTAGLLAFLGLVLGVPEGSDEGLVRSVGWGLYAGMAVGSVIVGAVAARDSELAQSHWVLWLLTPGMFIGVPTLGSFLLNAAPLEGMKQLAFLVVPCGLVAELSAMISRRASAR